MLLSSTEAKAVAASALAQTTEKPTTTDPAAMLSMVTAEASTPAAVATMSAKAA